MVGRLSPQPYIGCVRPKPPISTTAPDPSTEPERIIAMLRDRGLSPDVLSEIAGHPGWTGRYEVRRGLAVHPRTPLAIATTMVGHLYWRDLAAATADMRVHPVIRRRAEEHLRTRLEEMQTGERISLARTAVRGLVRALRDQPDPRIVIALLDNPRLVEEDVVAIASRPTTAPDVLRRIADGARWGERLAVRLAILRNPRTPAHVALRVLDRLPRHDRKRLGRRSDLPRIVRIGIERASNGARGGAVVDTADGHSIESTRGPRRSAPAVRQGKIDV